MFDDLCWAYREVSLDAANGFPRVPAMSVTMLPEFVYAKRPQCAPVLIAIETAELAGPTRLAAAQ